MYESGTPVLIFDRKVHGESYTAYQGADNAAIGESAARAARNLCSGEAEIIEIRGLSGSTPADERHQGFAAYVERTPGMRIAGEGYGNWGNTDAARVADSLLELYPKANLIYAHNDRMAIAAAEVARQRGRTDMKIVGIDAAPEIGIKAVADSLIDVTFLYPTEGYRLIRTALAILDGQPYERITRLPASAMVDASNAEILMLQNSELQEETERIQWLKSRVDEYWTRHSAQTTLLYAVIAILVLLIVLTAVVLRAFWARKRHQEKLAQQNHMLEQQRDTMMQLNEQLNEATQSKLMFFTNVSHDLRTPLTLIEGPVEQLAEDPHLDTRQKSLMKIARKNVRILKRLINQVLDFRKYENGKLTLHLSEADLASLLTDWCDAFRAIAVDRDMDFRLEIEPGVDFKMAIDVERIERVMFNLISNAFKYTPSHGEITVRLHRDESNVTIDVADSGKGISAEDLSHIFERFYQVDKVHPNGSGIGLSLAKGFIELHEGTLEVESEPGKGSVFKVTLPLRHVAASASPCAASIRPEDVATELDTVQMAPSEVDPDRTLVLVIDDNQDIRTYISSLLGDDYTIITASDGAKGVKMASKYVPDLVICDVMMPVMDGLECCRRLKNEQATSHIPVLMLTACSMDEQRIQGYECGADGYVSKPFNAQVLIARCKSLIENRRRILTQWPGLPPASGQSPHREQQEIIKEASAPETNATQGVGEIDSEFYRKFVSIVESEMGNADLSVDSIASSLGLGRTQFYRKLKNLTNYSPVELIRNMRLARARVLLTTTEQTISEIAYGVGFSTPAYFSKCYKDRYHETPSEIRERLKPQG